MLRSSEFMATTVPEPPKIRPGGPGETENGNGGFRDLVPRVGALSAVQDYAPAPARTGIWVGLAAIAMTFAAFTSALVVRQGAGSDWHHLTLPRILYWNTLVLLASSVTLEISRRRVAAFMGGPRTRDLIPSLWFYVTFLLGGVFVGG